MLFTLNVYDKQYSCYGVVHKDVKVIRTAINNGIGTKVVFYLFDGSVFYLYDLLFTRKLTSKELQYLLANSANNKITTTLSYKETLIKETIVSKASNYGILYYGLIRLVITGVDYSENELRLYLFNTHVLTIRLISNTLDFYQNTEIVDLAGKSRNSVETVARQLFHNRLIRLDGGIHELTLNYLDRYGIIYEVIPV